MYELIGKILVYGFEISAIIVIIALGIGYAALRRKVYFCGLFADILDFFYYPLLSIFSWFNKEKELDMIMVNLKNYANKEKFAASKNRIIIGGQCSRHLDCPASSTREGIKCVSCGRCSFSKIKNKAEKKGYKLYIMTGSSFIKYIIKEGNVDGILAVICNYEVNKGMRAIRKYNIPVYAVPLTKDGCYNTEFDVDKVIEAMDI